MLEQFIKEKQFKSVITIGSKYSDNTDFKKYGKVISRVDDRVISLITYAKENPSSIDCVIINGKRPHSDAMNCLKSIQPGLSKDCCIVLLGTLPQSEVDTLLNNGPYIGETFKTALDLAQVCELETYTDHYGTTIAKYNGKLQHDNPHSDAYNYNAVKGVLKRKINTKGPYKASKVPKQPKPVPIPKAIENQPEATSELPDEDVQTPRRRKRKK